MFKNNTIKALLINWRWADVHLPYVFLQIHSFIGKKKKKKKSF